MGHEARIIPMDGRPKLNDRIRHWNGDSRGRWDGDTLVIETANYSAKSDIRGASENLKVTERLTRVGPGTPMGDTVKFEPLDTWWISLFLIAFAALIGPVNVLWLAPATKRHRLFFTTPAISLARSATQRPR